MTADKFTEGLQKLVEEMHLRNKATCEKAGIDYQEIVDEYKSKHSEDEEFAMDKFHHDGFDVEDDDSEGKPHDSVLDDGTKLSPEDLESASELADPLEVDDEGNPLTTGNEVSDVTDIDDINGVSDVHSDDSQMSEDDDEETHDINPDSIAAKMIK